MQHEGRWWRCEWVPARQRYCWWLAAADGSRVGHTIWRPPWLIGSGQGDDSTMVLLGWCLVRQWIPVPASTYCGGASFSSSSKWWILLLFTETGAHSVKLCKVVDYTVMAQRTFPLVPCSRPQRFPSCSLLIRWSSWLCRSRSSCAVVGDSRDPTVAAQFFWTLSFARPLCATTVVWSMFWRSSSTVLTSL